MFDLFLSLIDEGTLDGIHDPFAGKAVTLNRITIAVLGARPGRAQGFGAGVDR